MTAPNQITSKINALLTKNYDAEKGYKKAAEIVENNKLKQFFETQAQQRSHFGHQLKSEIQNFDAIPDTGTSLKGDAHRTWIDIKTTFTSNDEKAILNEVQTGEQAALEEYRTVINDVTLPPSTKSIVTHQKTEVENAIRAVKNYETMLS